jgi:hypothetical protein
MSKSLFGKAVQQANAESSAMENCLKKEEDAAREKGKQEKQAAPGNVLCV